MTNNDLLSALIASVGFLIYTIAAITSISIGLKLILKDEKDMEEMKEQTCKNCALRIWQSGNLYCGLTAESTTQESTCKNYTERKEDK